MSKVIKLKQSDVENIVRNIISERHQYLPDDFDTQIQPEELPNDSERYFDDVDQEELSGWTEDGSDGYDRQAEINYGVEDDDRTPRPHELEGDIDESEGPGVTLTLGTDDDGNFYVMKNAQSDNPEIVAQA